MLALNVPIESITELKKSPMKVIDESKKNNTGVYILNNNKPVGVTLDVDLYENLLRSNQQLEALIEDLKNQLFDAQIDLIALARLQDKDRGVIPATEVMGKDWNKNLENIHDDWA